MAKKPTATAWPVLAKNAGLYDGHRKTGEVFPLSDPKHFAPSWMEAQGWIPGVEETTSEPAAPPAADPTTSLRARVAELEGENADLRDIGSRASTAAANLQEQVAKLEGELATVKNIGVADFLAANGLKPGDLLEILEDGTVRVVPAGQTDKSTGDGASDGKGK